MIKRIKRFIGIEKQVKSLEYIFVVWLAVVLAAYFYFHNYLFLYVVSLALWLLFWLVWKLNRRIKVLKELRSFKIYFWQISLFVLAASWLVVFIVYLVYIFYPTFNFFRAVSAGLNIFVWLSLFLSFLLFLGVFSLSLGRKFFSLFKIELNLGLLTEIFYLGSGLALAIYFSYFVAWAGWLRAWFLWPVFLLTLFFIRQELIFYGKKFFNEKIIIKEPVKGSYLAIFSSRKFWTVVLAAFVLLFCSSLKLVAQTADDIAVYANLPQLFSELGRMVPFYNSPTAAVAGISLPWEASLVVLTGSLYIQLLPLFFLFSFLIGFYLFLKRYSKGQIAEAAIWLILIVPSNIFFVASQKVDFIAVFFLLLSFIALWAWREKKENKYLNLSAAFLGLAVAVKFSALLFAFILAIYLVYLFLVRILKFKDFFIFGLISVLFVLPVLSYNFINYHNPLVHFLSLEKRTDEFFSAGQQVTMLDLFKHSSRLLEEKKFITNITRQNKVYVSKWKNWLWTLWNMAVNQRGLKVIYVQPGPWLLIFLPFWLIYFWLGRLYKDKLLSLFYFVSSVGFLVWLVLGRQRPWYGMIVFFFSFVMAAAYLKRLSRSFVKKIVNFFLISFTFFFFVLSLVFINPNYVPVWAGEKSVAEVRAENTWYSLAQQVNKEAEKNPQMRVLVLPGQNAAYIKQNNTRVITTSYGYYWSQIVAEAGSLADVYDFLRAQGVTHILYLPGFESWIESFSSPAQKDFSLLHSFSVFPKFRERYLKEISCLGENCLYKLKENQ